MGNGHLRHVSLSVDEADPGHFYWVLMESTGDIAVWSELMAADQDEATYGAALRAGLAMLEGLGDLAIGPRVECEDENPPPVGPSPGDAERLLIV